MVQVKLYFDCLGADGGTDKPPDSVQTAGATKARTELHTATVEVTVAELQPKDIYKRFFEDPSNGGGEVKDIQFPTADTVLVTFAKAAGTLVAGVCVCVCVCVCICVIVCVFPLSPS